MLNHLSAWGEAPQIDSQDCIGLVGPFYCADIHANIFDANVDAFGSSSELNLKNFGRSHARISFSGGVFLLANKKETISQMSYTFFFCHDGIFLKKGTV